MDGNVDREEFMALRPVIGHRYVMEFMGIDVHMGNSDRKISFDEFHTAYRMHIPDVPEGTIATAFKICDSNKDSFIDF